MNPKRYPGSVEVPWGRASPILQQCSWVQRASPTNLCREAISLIGRPALGDLVDLQRELVGRFPCIEAFVRHHPRS
jgi:hypothetical protein